ncbi:ABC transporter ATP-binding protein [Variovorax sp. J22R133]|uniref:ABC transporter ATP-binding protein n=1 Tax=Variovorax brevis TaxID=3053503 RepID=UPI0025765FB6|nr:ABC transporter ATP-binding protein [Variovorax sp. J22R133]MDM0116500.1 ABC transporter ATP-binding protein [Variovorax sp. J22R133]
MDAAQLNAVGKAYHLDAVGVSALRHVDLTVRSGLVTVICGASGSGKTTLLNLIGGLDRPSSGSIQVAGKDIGAMDDNALSDFRARSLGIVFQNFNLLPVLTAFENVEYPLVLVGRERRQRHQRVRELLHAVGLADKAGSRPGELSGGQRQRVAIARALAAGPQIVLADEPTANLDSQTGAQIIALMRSLQREQQVSFIISSHDAQVIEAADDLIRIKDGSVAGVCRAKAVA